VVDPRAICERCGHTRDWHDRDAVRTRLRSDPLVERPCYREVGEAPCRCEGFRESGAIAVSALSGATRGLAPGSSIVRVAALALLLVVMGLGLLYAYRSQTPSVPEVDISQALRDINAGRVRAVTISAHKATLEFRDNPSRREQTTLPDPDTVLARALLDYNAAHPSQTIEVKVDEGPPGPPLAGLIDLLPVLLIVLIGALIFSTMTRRRSL